MQETIRYAWGTSSLGEFLCAASTRGLVSLEFGKRESSRASILQRRFRQAALVEDRATLQEVIEKAASLIEHPA
jgi:AraC family transcriptional regulator of adaptative response/methylated-DNA-[protein]-cysteine methyltransferase